MAGIDSNSPVLPPIVSGTDGGWSFDSASISDTSVTLAEGTESGDEPAPDEPEPAPAPTLPAKPATEPIAAKPAQPGKAKQTISQRTAVLKAELADTLRQRAEARQELDALRAEAARARPAAQPAPARQPDRQPAPVSKLGPAPDWDTFEQEGKTWREYEAASRAHTLAEAEERAESRIRAEIAAIDTRAKTDQARARDAEVARAYGQKMEAAEAKYPDFAPLVDANLAGVKTTGFMRAILKYHAQGAEVLYHWARNPHEAEILSTLRETRPIMDAVAKAEDPIPLLSHFAAHRAEFEALTLMPPAEQLYELGRLAERLSGARVSSDPPRRSSVFSPAPPFRAMGGTAAAGGADSDDSGDDFAAYVRKTNRDEALKAGRRR